MKRHYYCLAIVLLGLTRPVLAASASEASIRALLEATHVHQMFEDQRGQIVAMMDQAGVQALHGQQPNARQQQAIEQMKARMLTLVQGELDWARLEPLYIHLYQESFSDEEIAGMLSFYRSPTGQAVVRKMPGLTQKIVADMQRVLLDVMPKMQQVQDDFAAEMERASP